MQFGAGRRTCLGKNIAILEIKKLIPVLLLNYDIQIVDPHNYKTENAWFVRQTGLQAVVHRRPASNMPPALNIPPSTSIVDVRVIDPGTTLDLQPSLFWQPPLRGLTNVTAPTYSFLISTTNTNNKNNCHIIFDLSVRQDWENLAPTVVSMIKSQTSIQKPCNIADVLDSDSSSLGIRSKDIEAIIWSHAHFDHTGDPSNFPSSTDLIVGPGIRDTHWPGYPTDPTAINLDSDIANRRVGEVSFDETDPKNNSDNDNDKQKVVQIGSFDAVDYFKDGSFYLLNAPGHSVGHICGLARVTPSPNASFVFMGGDACHHAGVLRPSSYLPCPRPCPCPRPKLQPQPQPQAQRHRGLCASKFDEAVFTLAPTLTNDYAAAQRTVEGIKELDASEEVFVVLAHDATSRGNIDFYPKTINDWRVRGYDKKTRWLLCGELEDAMDGN